MSDGTGSITDSFDDLNEVTQSVRAYTGLSNQTLTYTRYPDGSREELTTPAGNQIYYYDSDGRYTSMSSPAGTSYATYYNNGWQETRTLPNSIASTYSLNAVGALTGISSVLSGTTISAFSSFTYDGVFNLSGFSANYGTGSTLPNGARTFGYDSKDRLTASSIPTSNTTTVSSTFGFDSAGNRTGVNSTTIPFNSDNQCSSSGYTFDGNGNPTSYNGTSLSFDPENRVTAIGSLNSSTYRADGLRATKTVGSTTTYYLYDGAEPIIELNSSGTVTALNVFAPDGLVARVAGSTTIEYVLDQQGNVADRTDTSGTLQSVTQYDAWGNEQAISGTPTDPFGYNAQSGYYLDRETGLYLCQHRLYDPGNARWLNRDPIGYGGGTNLYGYCFGSPDGMTDPNGLSAATVALIYLVDPIDTMWALLLAATGTTHTDGEGEFYVTGGAFSRVNRGSNAVTFGGYTFINPSAEPKYAGNPGWRNHEHEHNMQNQVLGPLYFPATAGGYCSGFLDETVNGPPSSGNNPTGHDHSFMERDAQNHNGTGSYQNPWEPLRRALPLMYPSAVPWWL